MRNQNEKYIEDQFCKYLDRIGKKYKRQVKCEMGIADVVTKTAIYEIKYIIDLYTLRSAISQLLGYKQYLGSKNVKLYVVGIIQSKVRIDKYVKFADLYNISIIYFEDVKFEEIKLIEQKRVGKRQLRSSDNQNNSIYDWIDLFVLFDEDAKISVRKTLHHYHQWCKVMNKEMLGEMQFFVFMNEKYKNKITRERRKYDGRVQMCYIGIDIFNIKD